MLLWVMHQSLLIGLYGISCHCRHSSLHWCDKELIDESKGLHYDLTRGIVKCWTLIRSAGSSDSLGTWCKTFLWVVLDTLGGLSSSVGLLGRGSGFRFPTWCCWNGLWVLLVLLPFCWNGLSMKKFFLFGFICCFLKALKCWSISSCSFSHFLLIHGWEVLGLQPFVHATCQGWVVVPIIMPIGNAD